MSKCFYPFINLDFKTLTWHMIHVLVIVCQVITLNLIGLLQACSQIHYIMFELNLFTRVFFFILLFLWGLVYIIESKLRLALGQYAIYMSYLLWILNRARICYKLSCSNFCKMQVSSSHLVKNSILTWKFLFKYKVG